ncbi:hypothetical protein E2C01_035198 [Portunus trituberculatus]|uniref:Uncharacterized protein n=1 Tax=Portunus trituberculatus TaxID=210409 RepID=A0A5B7F934_PORTR|nr:hypothetical protein [Portunus trituberculatus]
MYLPTSSSLLSSLSVTS